MNLLPAIASKPIRLFSFGAGVQSVAIAALHVMRDIRPYDAFVWANVGDDSENPETLEYMQNIFLPWAHTHNLNFVEVSSKETLYQNLIGDNRSVGIPVWMKSGAPGRRACTMRWKIQQVNRWIKSQSVTHAIVGIGFSTDEAERARPVEWSNVDFTRGDNRRLGFWHKYEYPLLDSLIARHECESIINRAGLPLPPKSACWFCPYKSKSRWVEDKMKRPALFAQAQALEARINEKRAAVGFSAVSLHPGGELGRVIPSQLPLWDFEDGGACNSGYCFT